MLRFSGTITEICDWLKNWFVRETYIDTFTAANGDLTVDGAKLEYLSNQYVRITGSVLNDGIWKTGTEGAVLQDETFKGRVELLGVPVEIENLSLEIDEWRGKYGKFLSSPFASENKADYSYSLKSGTGAGGSVTWQDMFGSRLTRYKKI